VNLATVSPGHSTPVSTIGNDTAAGVNVLVALFHVFPATETFISETVQTATPPLVTVIVRFAFVVSTTVVLVAVRVHAPAVPGVAAMPTAPKGMFVVQAENVGPAGSPAALVVTARSPPVDRTPERKVHVRDTPEGDISTPSVPSAVSVVFAGSQLAAEADPAPAIIIPTATTAAPTLFILYMLPSFIGKRRAHEHLSRVTQSY
jgi:hypothetical protein